MWLVDYSCNKYASFQILRSGCPSIELKLIVALATIVSGMKICSIMKKFFVYPRGANLPEWWGRLYIQRLETFKTSNKQGILISGVRLSLEKKCYSIILNIKQVVDMVQVKKSYINFCDKKANKQYLQWQTTSDTMKDVLFFENSLGISMKGRGVFKRV